MSAIQVHAQALLQKHGVRPNDPRAKVLLELAAELEPKEVKANFSGKLELKEGLSGKRYEYRGDEFTIVIYSKETPKVQKSEEDGKTDYKIIFEILHIHIFLMIM